MNGRRGGNSRQNPAYRPTDTPCQGCSFDRCGYGFCRIISFVFFSQMPVFSRHMRKALLFAIFTALSSSMANAASCCVIICWSKFSYQNEGAAAKTRLADCQRRHSDPRVCSGAGQNVQNFCGCAETCSQAVCTKLPNVGSNHCFEAHYKKYSRTGRPPVSNELNSNGSCDSAIPRPAHSRAQSAVT